MTQLAPITLREAETSAAVANTPIFLVRRLLENPALRRAYELHGTDKIFAALASFDPQGPRNLEERTEIYFYLVALSFDTDLSWLRRTRALKIPNIKWLSEIAEYLINSRKSTVTSAIEGPRAANPPLIFDPPVRRIETSNTTTQLIIPR